MQAITKDQIIVTNAPTVDQQVSRFPKPWSRAEVRRVELKLASQIHETREAVKKELQKENTTLKETQELMERKLRKSQENLLKSRTSFQNLKKTILSSQTSMSPGTSSIAVDVMQHAQITGIDVMQSQQIHEIDVMQSRQIEEIDVMQSLVGPKISSSEAAVNIAQQMPTAIYWDWQTYRCFAKCYAITCCSVWTEYGATDSQIVTIRKWLKHQQPELNSWVSMNLKLPVNNCLLRNAC